MQLKADGWTASLERPSSSTESVLGASSVENRNESKYEEGTMSS